MRTKPKCRVCDAELNDENWYASNQKTRNYICKTCDLKRWRLWRMKNPEKAKVRWTRNNRKHGFQPFYENKECTLYLGVHIAEQILSQAFNNVQRMPMSNPGYDVICNRNKRIDIKSSCRENARNRWLFNIKHNQIADYFLCLAFDNRKDLNPLHVWLLPGSRFNHLMNATISLSTIHKWDVYMLDITNISQCCNAMRSDSQ